MNVVYYSYRILFITVSIKNIVDMSGNKQFVKTREYMSFIITDALRSSLLPSGESGERVSNSAEAVAAYRTKREKYTPFLRKIFKDDPQFFCTFSVEPLVYNVQLLCTMKTLAPSAKYSTCRGLNIP